MRHVAILIGLTLVACSNAPASAIPSATAAASAVASASSTVNATPTTTVTPTASARPSPTAIVGISQVFHPLATAWRPNGPTLLVSSSDETATTLVAVRFDRNGAAGPALPLVSLIPGPFDVRPDGGAIALVVGGDPVARIATWDLHAGTGAWIALDERAVVNVIWSRDGGSLFYIVNHSIDSATVFAIGADGRGKRRIATLDRMGELQSVTPDGRGIVWSRGQQGGSADLIDIASGASRKLADVASVQSWRTMQPRVLLSVGGCCAGRPGGSLVAIDDATLTSTIVAERGPYGDPAWGGASWDPAGTRVAAGRFTASAPYDAQLVILDPATGSVVQQLGELGVHQVLWLPEGIVVTSSLTVSGANGRGSSVVSLASPQGGPSKTLYGARDLGRMWVLRP